MFGALGGCGWWVCRIAVVVGSVVVLGFAGVSEAGAVESPLRLTGGVDRSVYRPGEEVVQRWSLTNNGSAPCQISQVSRGTLAVEVVRDGNMVFGEVRPIDFTESLGSVVISGLTMVAPGARVDIAPTGGADVWMLSWSPVGQDLLTRWPMDTPGKYEITAWYRVPPVAGLPADACPGTSSPAVVQFEIAERPSGGFPWVVVIGGGLALLALVLIVVWLVRRHRRAARIATPMVVAIALAVSGMPVAHAKIDVDVKGTEDFKRNVRVCLHSFDRFDPQKIVKYLNDDKTVQVTIEEQETPLFSENPSGAAYPAKSGPRDTIIKWHDKVGEQPRGEGEDYADNPCAGLYHELFHAFQNARGFPRNWQCGNTGIDYSEVEATFAQNEYLETQGHSKLRRTYGGKPLPRYEDRHSDLFLGCKFATIAPKPTPMKKEECHDGCGMSRTDPHVLTFDRARYDFQAVGEFVTARSADGAVEVHTRQAPLGGSRLVSANQAIALRVAGDRVGFYDDARGLMVRVNGQPVTVPAEPIRLPGGGTLTHPAPDADYEVSWPDGSFAWVNTFGMNVVNLTLKPDQRHRGDMSGLLGNFDANPANDLATRQGTSLSQPPAFDRLYGEFADSWRVAPADSLFDYAPGESTDTFSQKDYPARTVTAGELPNRADAEAVCRSVGVRDPAVLAECALDVGLTGQAMFAPNAAETQETLSGPGSTFPLRIGDSVSGDAPGSGAGAIAVPGERDAYHFVAAAGEGLVLARTTGSCATQITVLGPDDQPVAGGRACDGLLRFTPNLVGVHRIEVTGPDAGAYGFTLQRGERHGSELVDGDTVGPDQPWPGAGRIGQPGELDVYDIQLDGTAFFLAAPKADCAINARLESPSGQRHWTVHLCGDETRHPVPEPGRYQLKITGDNNTTGDYRFTFATEKPRTFPVSLGDRIDAGRLDLPGRVDRYEFDTTGLSRFRITNGTGPCEDVVLEIRTAADQENWRSARFGICGDHQSIPVPLSTNRTVILVFSHNAKTGMYSFAINST